MSLSFNYSTVEEVLRLYKFIDKEAEQYLKIIPKTKRTTSTVELKKQGIVDTLYFSLKEDNRVVAVIEGHMYEERDHNIIYVRQLIVHPSHRRKGYGSATFRLFVGSILTHLKHMISPELLDESLPRYIKLITENDESVPFWESLGFKEIDKIKGDRENDRRFKLDLEDDEPKKKTKTSSPSR